MKIRNRLITLVALFSITFSVAAFAAADDTRFVKVIAYDVNIRSGAGTEQPVIDHADYGDSYQVVSVQNGWYQVQLEDDKTGWISASLVHEGTRFSSSNPTIDVVEATDTLNVRDGASTSYDIITTITPGTKYPLLQTSGDWVQIRLPDERTGWVAKWLVTASTDKAKKSAQEEQQKGTVLADTLNIRSTPSEDAKILGTLKQGDLVSMLTSEGAWSSVNYQGQTGYVRTEFVRLPNQPAPAAQPAKPSGQDATLTLTASANLRTGPGTNFALLQAGTEGSTFRITGKSGNWYEIALQDGKKAWVAGWLTSVSGSTAAVPEQSHSLDNSLRGKTIVLDAGHGGIDVGAVGRTTGVYEKDLNLSLTRILYNKLLATGAHVVMTRPDDSFQSLQDRVILARNEKADLFISLHHNTNSDTSLSGTMTFYYKENGEDQRLAKLVQQELANTLKLPDLGARFGDYFVLRENPQTAILVETAFLSEAHDEQAARNPATQEHAAEAIFDGILKYFNS